MVLCLAQMQNPDGVMGSCPILPCLVPLVLRPIRTIMEATMERKTAAHIMMLWKYKPLGQDAAL
jgi:hypothetical protein